MQLSGHRFYPKIQAQPRSQTRLSLYYTECSENRKNKTKKKKNIFSFGVFVFEKIDAY